MSDWVEAGAVRSVTLAATKSSSEKMSELSGIMPVLRNPLSALAMVATPNNSAI